MRNGSLIDQKIQQLLVTDCFTQWGGTTWKVRCTLPGLVPVCYLFIAKHSKLSLAQEKKLEVILTCTDPGLLALVLVTVDRLAQSALR